MNLSERLVELRKERNLSQLELAEALNVSRQSISLWEKGSTTPSLDKLPLLAEFYDITIDELLYSPEEMPKEEAASYVDKMSTQELLAALRRHVTVILTIGVVAVAVIWAAAVWYQVYDSHQSLNGWDVQYITEE